jgi:UDP-N-acetylglucosamine 1-carboxyvinyltransferase
MARLILDLGEVGHWQHDAACALSRHQSGQAFKTRWSARLRGSVLLLGPLLARRGRALLAPPGGDFPARRTLHTHLEALESMGARPIEGKTGHALEVQGGLRPTSIYLYEASVTGTETALLAAAGAPGTTEIRHAACEPHVVELCVFLEQLGVGVSGAGTSRFESKEEQFRGAEHKLWGDYIGRAGRAGAVTAATSMCTAPGWKTWKSPRRS